MIRPISFFLILFGINVFARAVLWAQEPEVESVSNKVVVEQTDESNPVLESTDEEPIMFHLPFEHHAWGRFTPGAWREFQVTTETFDSQKKFVNRSVTTQKEILEEFDEHTYTLKVQAAVDLVGKRIVGDWKTRELHWATDGPGEITQTVRGDDVRLSLESTNAECQLWELTYRDDARLLLDRIYYHPNSFPYVVKRETFQHELSPEATVAEQQVEVAAWTVPYVLQGEMVACCCLRVLQQRSKGRSSRVLFSSPNVPGGEVAAWSSDYDSEGQLTRWSTMELVGFGLK